MSSCSDDPPVIVATVPDASNDADPSCPCSSVERGVPTPTGDIPLACFCAKTDWPESSFAKREACRSFDSWTNCPPNSLVFVETYTNCDLVKIGYASPYSLEFNVFDAASHVMVGAMRGDGNRRPTYACDGQGMNVISAGTIPGPECRVKSYEQHCWRAAPPDAGSTEICDCAPDEAGVTHWSDLSCGCGSDNGCPPYDMVTTSGCSAPATYESDVIETHDACNLVVVKVGAGLALNTFVYDATTHATVGVSFATATGIVATCRSKRVAEYRAGIFPPDDCPVTKTVRRCPVDGG